MSERGVVIFTTDNGTEVFTWPDGGQTPFAQSKGTIMEGGFRVPAMIRWPGRVPAGAYGSSATQARTATTQAPNRPTERRPPDQDRDP